MNPLRQLIPLLTLLIVTLAGCTTLDKTNNIQLGMTRAEVITAIGHAPAYTSATPDGTEILTFTFPKFVQTTSGQLIGGRVPFPVYLQEGKVIAYGQVRTGLDPDYIMEHRHTGGTTNKYESVKKK